MTRYTTGTSRLSRAGSNRSIVLVPRRAEWHLSTEVIVYCMKKICLRPRVHRDPDKDAHVFNTSGVFTPSTLRGAYVSDKRSVITLDCGDSP